jgi:hypothetical protein
MLYTGNAVGAAKSVIHLIGLEANNGAGFRGVGVALLHQKLILGTLRRDVNGTITARIWT